MPIQGERYEWPDDDGIRALSIEEECDRMVRCGGDAVCETCGKLLRKHPREIRLEPRIYLVRLCNGLFGKL